jgi:hypothetical protein
MARNNFVCDPFLNLGADRLVVKERDCSLFSPFKVFDEVFGFVMLGCGFRQPETAINMEDVGGRKNIYHRTKIVTACKV